MKYCVKTTTNDEKNYKSQLVNDLSLEKALDVYLQGKNNALKKGWILIALDELHPFKKFSKYKKLHIEWMLLLDEKEEEKIIQDED